MRLRQRLAIGLASAGQESPLHLPSAAVSKAPPSAPPSAASACPSGSLAVSDPVAAVQNPHRRRTGRRAGTTRQVPWLVAWRSFGCKSTPRRGGAGGERQDGSHPRMSVRAYTYWLQKRYETSSVTDTDIQTFGKRSLLANFHWVFSSRALSCRAFFLHVRVCKRASVQGRPSRAAPRLTRAHLVRRKQAPGLHIYIYIYI